MEPFFIFLKKSLVATVFTAFAFAAVYTPQDWNKPQTVEAWFASEPTQIMNNVELVFDVIVNTLSEGWNQITSWAVENLWIKESVLDGIAWALAKAIISSMVDSLINWINSGFKGSPMFVQDFSRFLTDVADRVMGEYIQNLGAPGSFLCDPFKLDIQIALALQYQRSRVDQPAPTCTLSGVINNLEGFLSGAQGSFGEGGWNDWFDITSQPETYTPYGAALAAQSGANIRILNAKGEEAFKLEWGDGFLSGEVCQTVSSASGNTQLCDIVKPGKTIEEALSFNIDSGRQSLIAADEIDEVVSALLGQLAQTIFSGASGLLGLSGGTGYTYSGFSGGSYLSQMNTEGLNIATGPGLAALEGARDTEIAYRDLAANKKVELQAIAASTTVSASIAAAAASAVVEADTVIATANSNITNLNALITAYTAATSPSERNDIMDAYDQLPLHSSSDLNDSENSWNAIITAAKVDASSNSASKTSPTDPTLLKMKDDLQTQKDYKTLAETYKPNLDAYASATTTSATSSAAATAASTDAQTIITNTTKNISDLTDVVDGYENATTDSLQSVYLNEYLDLTLYRQSDITASKAAWDAILP